MIRNDINISNNNNNINNNNINDNNNINNNNINDNNYNDCNDNRIVVLIIMKIRMIIMMGSHQRNKK